MNEAPPILHETRRRLRVALPADVDAAAVPGELRRIDGVSAVRVNVALACVVVDHDGRPEVRGAVLEQLARGHAAAERRARAGVRPRAQRPPGAEGHPLGASLARGAAWAPAALALAAPLAGGPWRQVLALSGVAWQALASRELRGHDGGPGDPAAVLLDSSSLAALVLGGQAGTVAASMLLRQLVQSLSDRLVGQADELLAHLLPQEAARYRALRDPLDREGWWPLRELRRGDRIRLFAGDVVPLDGCVTVGNATLAPVLPGTAARPVGPGDAVAAGERLDRGTLELRAEADAEHSRLARLRSHLRHVIAAREPAGRLGPSGHRGIALPMTAAALVYGFTRDPARAAAMLQADPQRGLELAQPLAREAALLALARAGLVASGLETLARLAVARTLVLQDSGVLACGRWVVQEIDGVPGVDAQWVRQCITRLAGAAPEETPSLPDRVLREWQRHGAVLRTGGGEVHLASPARLRRIWGLDFPRLGRGAPDDGREDASSSARTDPAALMRRFALVAEGRVVASVTLRSAWRAHAAEHLAALRQAGFLRIVLVADDGGERGIADAPPAGLGADAWICEGPTAVGDWLAEATSDGMPAVVVHTVLRDTVPPGSLGLAPLEADAGPHGVLAGDPLASLLAARRLAQEISARLGQRHRFAIAANAALMTASAVRWLPPMAVTLMNHGAGLLLLLDSLRLESLRAPQGVSSAPAPETPSPERAQARRPRTRRPPALAQAPSGTSPPLARKKTP
ncbi:MAG: hypothetical protein JNJ71_10360 [Rubrivivax sp.]|nr:hypothetical protein [Rubrivivax sp.]